MKGKGVKEMERYWLNAWQLGRFCLSSEVSMSSLPLDDDYMVYILISGHCEY